ncbi:MAG: RNA polymerase subunit sigma-70, partial [Ignavibacteriales bacterium CG_4_9_14_3_um_filter_30_11]
RKMKKHFISFDDEKVSENDNKIGDWSTVPSFAIENQELKDILDNAIGKLSPDYRIVFILRDVNGFSTEETGNITNLSVPAVKSRLYRARTFLRDEINMAFKK